VGFTKRLLTPQVVYISNGKVKEGFAFRRFLVLSGGLDDLEGLHCFSGTYGQEGLHIFV
jgi:hypothetical protein